MPELPEVENVRLQLLSKIKNKTIQKVKVFNLKSTDNNQQFTKILEGKKFKYIDRVGKLMIFSFEKEDDLFLLAHLKMTGQFFYTNKNNLIGGGHSMSKNDISDLPNKHTRIHFTLSDGSNLYFNDMRKFGYIKIANAKEVAVARARFGEEPINANFNHQDFYKKLQRRNTSIKATLLDQTFVAGLGNIYVDEALFAAKVRPDRTANTLTPKEAKAVIKAGGEIMLHSIEIGGTTFQSFADTDGHAGNFTQHLKVFGKHKTMCPRCKKAEIQKTRVASRGTHFCPNCQK
jgi:formamidopyrimidine-DNA glycosylase